jgi:hypothetical protein
MTQDAKNAESRSPPISSTAEIAVDGALTHVDQENGEVKPKEWTFRYWPWYKPPPEGWEIVDELEDCHHGAHAVLLRQKG